MYCIYVFVFEYICRIRYVFIPTRQYTRKMVGSGVRLQLRCHYHSWQKSRTAIIVQRCPLFAFMLCSIFVGWHIGSHKSRSFVDTSILDRATYLSSYLYHGKLVNVARESAISTYLAYVSTVTVNGELKGVNWNSLLPSFSNYLRQEIIIHNQTDSIRQTSLWSRMRQIAILAKKASNIGWSRINQTKVVFSWERCCLGGEKVENYTLAN